MRTEGQVRVGVALSLGDLANWQLQLLQALGSDPCVDLRFVYDSGRDAAALPWPGGYLRKRYLRAHGRGILGRVHRDPPQPANVIQGPLDTLRSRLIAEEVDVLIHLGGTPPEALEGIARRGLWSYRWAAPVGWEAAPPGLVEHVLRIPLTRIALECCTGGRWQVLRQASCLHQPERLRAMMHAAIAWPLQLLRQERVEAEERAGAEIDAPGLMTCIGRAMPLLPRLERRRSRPVEWNIGVLPQPIEHLLQERPNLNIRWLPPPELGAQRMEPFGMLDSDGDLNVLYAKGHRGRPWSISRMRPKQDNVLKRSRSILELAGDLHYPFTLQHGPHLYFIVSNREQDRTLLHRLNPSLDGSEVEAVLWPSALHAPSVVEYEGRWWLFGCGSDLPDEGLLIFHANSLEGPYAPHADNPVRVAIEGARPAGTPFLHAGSLWRPGLDRSDPKAPRVVIHRVLELTPTRFREVAVRHVGPFRNSQYPDGTRTVATIGGVTLVDGQRCMTDRHVDEAKQREDRHRKHRKRNR
jgi:hypothetical protein